MCNNEKITNEIVIGKKKIKITWFPGADPSKADFSIRQIYGVCFNESGEVLVVGDQNNSRSVLPGGTPEPIDLGVWQNTLKRETMEEASVKIDETIIPIGMQLVEEPGRPPFYQVRAVCRVLEVLKHEIDPDTGIKNHRTFMEPASAIKELNWGEIGTAIICLSNEAYLQKLRPI